MSALRAAAVSPPRRNRTVLAAMIGSTYNDVNTLAMPPVK